MMEDLTELLRAMAEREIAGIDTLYGRAAAAIRALQKQTEALDHVLGLSASAAERGIRHWQEAHPGKERTWPDRADMVEWMADRIDLLEGALARYGEHHDDCHAHPFIHEAPCTCGLDEALKP